MNKIFFEIKFSSYFDLKSYLSFQTEGVELLFNILQRVVESDDMIENVNVDQTEENGKTLSFGAVTNVMVAKEKFEQVIQSIIRAFVYKNIYYIFGFFSSCEFQDLNSY
jgi:hypothetical protein